MSKRTAEKIQKVIRNLQDSQTTSPTYESTSVYNSKKKQVKVQNYSIILYDYVEFVSPEVEEKYMKLLGRGTVSIKETFGQLETFSELVDVCQKFIDPSPDRKDLMNSLLFLKRVGRKRAFTRHQHSSTFKYDAYGIKDLCDKDCKTLYLSLKKPFTRQQSTSFINLTSQGSSLSSSGYDENTVFDDSLNNEMDVDMFPAFDIGTSASGIPVSKESKTLEQQLQKLDILHKKVYDSSKVTENMMIALVLLCHFQDFRNVLADILKDQEGSTSEIELTISQVLVLFGNEDSMLWKLALDDLNDEFKANECENVVDALNLLFQSLKSLDGNIWQERFFGILFKSSMIKEHYSENFSDFQEDIDNPICYINLPKRCHTLEDIFSQFTNSKLIDLPNIYEGKVDESKIWERKFFQKCPNTLIVNLDWKFDKKHFVESSERLYLKMLEDQKSVNRESYYLAAFLIRDEATKYLFVNCRSIGKWKIYLNGVAYDIDMTEDIMKKFYSLENAILELAIYNLEEISVYVSDKNIKEYGQFLMKRLIERKDSSTEVVMYSHADVLDKGSKENQIRQRLKNIFGQEKLKEKMYILGRRAYYDKRRGLGRSNDVSDYHMAFYGNPGVGKTMAARSMAGVFKDLGIIEDDNVVEVQRSDLVADHIGGTAQKTERVIRKAEGGILFLDEAYRLCSSSEKDFGKEALETIMGRMNANVNPKVQNPIFIFAGYKKEMEQFLSLNPGMRRRVKTRLLFENFKPMELAEITKKKLNDQKRKYPVGNDFEKMLVSCFESVPQEKVSLYNAALCSELIEHVQVRQEGRLNMDCDIAELSKFSLYDFEDGIKDFLNAQLMDYEPSYHNQETQTDACSCSSKVVPEVLLNIPGIGQVPSTPVQ